MEQENLISEVPNKRQTQKRVEMEQENLISEVPNKRQTQKPVEIEQENLISEVQQFLRSKKVSKYLKKHDMVVTLSYAQLSLKTQNTKIVFAIRIITQYPQPQYFLYFFSNVRGKSSLRRRSVSSVSLNRLIVANKNSRKNCGRCCRSR